MLIPYLKHNIFAFADTHGLHNHLTIPLEADVLICAGDGVNDIEIHGTLTESISMAN